jgi:hypothetical protein
MGSSGPVSLRGFGVEQVGGVPRDASLAVITNASSAPSRIDAYARIEDTVTKDSWVVVDPTRTVPTAETYVVPFVPPPAGTVTQYDVFLVNGSAAAVTASVEFVGSPRRLRAVNLNRATSTFLSPSLALSPLRTTRGSFSSGAAEGFVRFTAPAGAVMANGRLTSSVPGRAGRSGTALPVLPVSVAIRPGESRRFTGVDDASATTVAARTSGTFRSSLMFVETTGEDATVEVTLRFFFAAGTKVSGQATASRQFTIAAGRSLLIRDLARELIGAQRDKVGDLRNMVLDVTVTTWSRGRVLSWLTSVDNGTDDVITRAE